MSTWTALEYYRQILPHKAMVRNVPEVTAQFEKPQDKLFSIDTLTDDELKQYDIVCFLRLVQSTKEEDPIDRCHRLGCKVVFDIDDYWILPPDHNMKWQSKNVFRTPTGELIHYRSEGKSYTYEQAVPLWMKRCDLVTTTTEYFKEQIEKTGVKTVEVLPNCIDPLEPQFADTTPTKSSLVRFGWIGGVHHRPDLELIKETFSGFAKNRKSMLGIQFVLGGFNPNREYLYIEKLMTSNYSLFRQDRSYIDYLLKYSQDMDHYSLHKPYRRLWARPVHNYAGMYNEIDVALIPLRENKFSSCKSELKLIEAGWFKKPVICSDVLPYNSIVKDDENGLLVKGSYWSSEMRFMMDEGYRKEQGEALHETVKERFDIDKWSMKRYELYKKIMA